MEVCGSTSEKFASLWMLYGRLPKSVNFGKLCVNFGKKSNWYPWRVQFGINCTPLVQSESSNFVECTIRKEMTLISKYKRTVVGCEKVKMLGLES